MDEISQLLWAGQGITSDWGGRTAPSAGALYPIRLYLVVGAVDGLEPGVYLYEPSGHSLREVICGDIRRDLKSAALDQEPVGNAPVSIVITAIPSITEAKYGDRSMRYIDNEAGCVAENIYLECESLGLGTVTIGAFYDDDVAALLGSEVSPRLIMPVGARE
jgi:SagB-type dehydrogenase family enzyme